MKVVFLGAGNLATQLALAFSRKGVEIAQIYSRTDSSAKMLADKLKVVYTSDLKSVMIDADVYIYALKDDVLAWVAAQVKAPNALHLHTAGSMTLSVFGSDKPHCGVLYPMQTFSKNRPVDFAHIPIFVETAQEVDLQRVKVLANSISEDIYEADAAQRAKTHLAAVFACNFTNCMYAISAELLQQARLPFKIMLPLIDETAAKVHNMEPRKAQTGPAVRYDCNVMEKHIQILPDEELKTIYRMLSDNIHSRLNCC